MKVTGYKARKNRGKWDAVVYWKDEDGKRHQKSRRIEADSEKVAERLAADFYIECKSGNVPMKKETAGSAYDYAAGYFMGRLERHEYERSTYATNMKHIRAWERALGNKRLGQITESDIRKTIADWFSDGRDATTVDKRITAFQEVYRYAKDRGDCPKNPFDGIRRPKKGWKVLNGCNDSEVRNDIAETLANLPLDDMKIAFNLAYWTGMRRGEICALRWDDIDLANGAIWVRHAIGDGNGRYVKLPKSDKPRDIAVPSYLRMLLHEWKRKNGFGYVVGGAEYLNPDYLTHAFTHLAKFKGWKGAAGKRLTLHDLRHTVATTLISEGADVKTVQSVLGHSSAAITLDMYASADKDAKKNAAALLERAVGLPEGSPRWAEPERKEAAMKVAVAL